MTTINIDALKDAIRDNLSHKTGNWQMLEALVTIMGDRNLAMDAGRALENYQHQAKQVAEIEAEVGFDPLMSFGTKVEDMPAKLADAIRDERACLDRYHDVERRVRALIDSTGEAQHVG